MRVDKVLDKVDYELIPVEDHPNEQAWQIRILRGEFVETILRFGNIAFNETKQCLNFNFFIVSSPDPDLTVKNKDLQEFAARILEDVLDIAHKQGRLAMREKQIDE